MGLLLLRGPSNGYELRKVFDGLVGPGWAINSGQVYDMLGNLVRKGWVERLGPRGAPGDSQTYRITSRGKREFEKWLATHSSRPRAHRETLYLKLVLAGPQDAHHLLEDIEIQKRACLDKLSAYSACPPPANASEWDTLAREAIDEDVTTELHGKLEWLEKLRKRVEHHLAEHPQDAPAQTGTRSRATGVPARRSDAA